MTTTELIGYVVGAIGTLFSWLIARRKNIAEANASELDNVEKAISVYRSIVTDLKAEMQQLRVEIASLSQQNNQLIRENSELKKQLDNLERKLSLITTS